MPRKPRGRNSGGQPGNRNALKSGNHTAKARAFRALVRKKIAAMKALAALTNDAAATEQKPSQTNTAIKR